MNKSKSLKEFAANLADLSKKGPGEIDRYIKINNVCFRIGTNQAQFYSDLELCVNAGRVDLVEYIIGRDMHTAFALWVFFKKPVDIVTEFFKKESTQAAISLMALNSMK